MVLAAKGVPLKVRPDLAIKFVSPSTRTIDLMEKAEDYALVGIPEYWAVDSERKEFSSIGLTREVIWWSTLLRVTWKAAWSPDFGWKPPGSGRSPCRRSWRC
jgi:hypothetical protein